MNELEKLLHGQAEAAEEFLVREKQVDRQGRVDLDEHGVLRVADEALYAQILFDFLEKKLDFLALFVNIGDGFRRKPEVIGQKLVAFSGFLIAVADTP